VNGENVPHAEPQSGRRPLDPKILPALIVLFPQGILLWTPSIKLDGQMRLMLARGLPASDAPSRGERTDHRCARCRLGL
jgi:hypothetical protein